MRCPHCQHDNREGARFCAGCGNPLASPCPACGSQPPPGAAFCDHCGTPLTGTNATATSPSRAPGPQTPRAYIPTHLAEKVLHSRVALDGERKQVTVLCADLKGSMEWLADLDSEEARVILDPVLERMMAVVHRYEGTVGRYAEESRQQGLDMQICVGLNACEVVVRAIGNDLHLGYTAVGRTMHLAARMEQLVLSGSIRITAETLRLVERFVQVNLASQNVMAGPAPGRLAGRTVFHQGVPARHAP